MESFEKQYSDWASYILLQGEAREGRNGETRSVFATSLVFDLQDSFPLLNGRRIYYKGVFGELAAMLRGPKTIADFEIQGCNYWKLWGNDDGAIRIDYGNKWLDFNGYNQLAALITGLKEDPYGRRHIISGWDPSTLDSVNLPCCHLLYQWYVRDNQYLDMLWYQRSADWMVGVPSDAVFAAAWNIILANEVGLAPGKVRMCFGDSHIYSQHYNKVPEYMRQLSTAMNKGQTKAHHILELLPGEDHTTFIAQDLSIHNYHPQPKIDFEVIA